MKKGMHLWTVSALLAVGGAFAQGQAPAQPAQPAQPEQTQNVGQKGVSKLALRLMALQKLAASAEGGLSQEQAQKILPYVMAIRSSAAVWDGTAEYYSQALDQILTEEQRKALEAGAAPAHEGGEGTATGEAGAGEGAGEGGTGEGAGEGAGAGGTETQQPATEQATQTEMPTLATDAPNPFAAEPYSAMLDQLIQQLQGLARGTGGNQG